jgi:sugar phosphate isomerase/epimerase
MPTPKSFGPPLVRRDFLTLAALAIAATTGGAASSASVSNAKPAAAPTPRKIPIGLELYSVRGELMQNLPDTLRAVGKMGYECVEFWAPYMAWTFPFAKSVRTLLDDLGLRCYSTHNSFASLSPGEGMDHAIELNQILGCRYIILSSPPKDTAGAEGWKRVCGQLTAACAALKPHGLFAGYHNHQTEWKPLEGGSSIMQLMAANTPPEFALQLDVGTALEAGIDPVDWIKSNPGRIRSVHLKDWTPGSNAEGKGYQVLFTEGVARWKEIIAAAESTGGVEYYLMEQEGSRFGEFETAQRCLENWKKFRGEV